jgi:anthranilate 1,2-dioxygenase small subunit
LNPALLLRLELVDVQDAYTAVLDEGRLEDWPAMFTEDCLYEIIPRENVDGGFPAPLMRCEGAAMLRDRVISLRHANIYETPHYRHMLSGHRVTAVDGNTADMRASYVVINTSQDGDSTIFQAGYYQDRLVRTADGWRFSVKRAVYDTHRVQTLLAYPV